MKRAAPASTEPSKFYYDIIIDHDSKHTEKRYKISSKAETTIDLLDPLLENPGDYNVCVSKYKIDVEGVPIMIPEIKQPQTINNLTKNYRYCTKYQIRMVLEIYDEQEKRTINYDKTSYLFKYFHKDKYKAKMLGYKKNDDGTEDNTYAYVDNTDESCFIYTHEEFYSMVRFTAHLLYTDIKTKYEKLFTNSNSVPFKFLQNGDKYYFYWHKDYIEGREWTEKYTEKGDDGKDVEKEKTCKYTIKSFHIWFSPNLYKYLGNGFYTNFCNNNGYDGWWEINYYIPTRTRIVNDVYGYNSDGYKYVTPSHGNLPNWNSMKAIVIGSDTLPVAEEFLPISHHDGSLTHYDTAEYRKMLSDLGIEFDNSNRDIFKKNTQKILDMYYPLSTVGGDIRSTIIFSSESPMNGQNIELLPASSISRFNIWVKWLDIYGNLYDLYLYSGCAVDIRLCFTKKNIIREDLAEGVEAILEALPEKKEKKEKKSNGRNDGIVLEGADQYGWVHL